MAFTYAEAVPWGRSFNECQRMFALTDDDLQRRILGCADGPANFNAEMKRQGHHVVSCDPLYQYTAAQIKRRIDATYAEVIGQTRLNQEQFIWDLIASPDELGRLRLQAMHDFLADYDRGRSEGRYLLAQLPELPFASGAFELALCSHFLFFYAEQLSLAFHRQAVDELCRVAQEVRLFPLLTYNAEPSPLVQPIIEDLQAAGRTLAIEPVPYQFQRGGNQMLRISPSRRR